MAVVRLRHEARSVCRCRLLQPAPRREELHELRELLVLCEAPRTRGGARRLLARRAEGVQQRGRAREEALLAPVRVRGAQGRVLLGRPN